MSIDIVFFIMQILYFLYFFMIFGNHSECESTLINWTKAS